MSDTLNSDGASTSIARTANSVSLGSTTVDEDMSLREANLLDTQIEALYQASVAQSKVATILTRLEIPSWV